MDDLEEPTRQTLPDWPRLMSERLAAAYLSIGTTSLRGLHLPVLRIGRRVLWDRQVLDRWADQLGGKAPADDELTPAEVERRFLEKRASGRKQHSTRAYPTKAQVTRCVRHVREAGIDVSGFKVGPDGTIEIFATPESRSVADELVEWERAGRL